MAVSITIEDLVADLRASQTVAAVTRVGRLLPGVVAIIERNAPRAPSAVQNRAASAMLAYLYDSGEVGEYLQYGNPFANSGARAMLAPWRRRVAHVGRRTPEAAAPAATGPTLIATFTPAQITTWQDTGLTLSDLPPVFGLNFGSPPGGAGGRRAGELITALRSALEAAVISAIGSPVTIAEGVIFNEAIGDSTDGQLSLSPSGQLLYGSVTFNFVAGPLTVWRL